MPAAVTLIFLGVGVVGLHRILGIFVSVFPIDIGDIRIDRLPLPVTLIVRVGPGPRQVGVWA
jgi:hypothetical protein